jgi:hypothetical protein
MRGDTGYLWPYRHHPLRGLGRNFNKIKKDYERNQNLSRPEILYLKKVLRRASKFVHADV